MTALWCLGSYYMVTRIFGPMMDPPVFTALNTGSPAAVRAVLAAPAGNATDEEIQAFIDEVQARYGQHVSTQMIGEAGSEQQGRQPFDYQVRFANATMDVQLEWVFYDQRTGLEMKVGSITIFDPDAGDLIFPPPAPPPGEASPAGVGEGGDDDGE
jgi:hypothetical protein